MTIKHLYKVIEHRTHDQHGDTPLHYGSSYAVPQVGTRVTVPTSKGPRTYKVSRITYCLVYEVHTIEVVNVKDVIDD
jgi:hypothetical protein